MMTNDQPIGIFDSGVGGLSILKAIRRLMPNENLIYIADTEFVPYGDKSEAQIENRVLTIATHLIDLDVKALVVGCNTATAAAAQKLRVQFCLPIVGLEPALKPAAENSSNKRVGVLATQSTLNSQKYRDLKTKFGRQIELVEKSSPLFVNLVESTPIITDQTMELIEKELDPFKRANVDSLVLGCTHYPFLKNAIKEIMGPQVQLFDSALPVAHELRRRLSNNLSSQQKQGSIHYYSSAPKKAQLAFDTILGTTTKLLPLR
jgi:glutamate racemase